MQRRTKRKQKRGNWETGRKRRKDKARGLVSSIESTNVDGWTEDVKGGEQK